MALRCLQLGYTVLKPFGNGSRYDMVIDRGRGFERVQVKTGRIQHGAIVFNTCSFDKRGQRRGYRNDAELFGVYCPVNGTCYLIPVTHTGPYTCHLRITAPANKQVRFIKWAKDYQL